MSTISSIVSVNIAVQNQGLTQRAYNICMLLSSTKLFTQLYQLYADMTEVQAVFPPSTPEYVCAQTFFSQTPTTTPLMIGRRPADSVTVSILPLVDIRYNYNIIINGFTTTSEGGLAISESAVLITNTAPGATTLFNAGTLINMKIDGVSMAEVTATGVNADDILAITNAMTAAGTGLSPATSDVISAVSTAFIISTLPVPTSKPATITNATVSGAGWEGVIDTGYEYSSAVLAAQLASKINTNANLTGLVTAGYTGTNVSVTSVTAEQQGGAPWTIDATTTFTNGTTSFNSAYNCAYLQVSTENNVGFFNATINGQLCNYQVPAPALNTSQIPASEGLFNAIKAVNPANVDVTYDASTELILVQRVPESATSFDFIMTTSTPQRVHIISRMYVNNTVASDTIQTSIDNIVTANPNFYAIACTDRTQDTVQAIAEYAQSNKKLFGTASSDSEIYNTAIGSDIQSIAAKLNAANGDRTFLMYHQDAGSGAGGVTASGSYTYSYPEMAWFGKMLGSLPGSLNWSLQTLSAIQPTFGLSTTQINNIFTKNVNVYSSVSGVSITRQGTLSGGSYIYIDILRGADWLVSSIQTSIYGALISSGKIPYTDKGIEVISSLITQQLQIAIDNGFVASSPAPTVTTPSAASVPLTDKQSRTLNNVSFTATLAGAINTVSINGTLTF